MITSKELLEEELDEIGLNPIESDNLDWLELPSIPERVYNPLLDYAIGTSVDPVEEMIKLCSNPHYIHFACRHILGIELLPFQLVILDTLWHKKMPMLLMTRGGGKTYMLAVYALLRMIFHPGCKVVMVGAAFRQSKAIFDYMCDIWDKSPVLRDIAGKGKKSGPRREVDRCEFRIGDSRGIAIPVGDGSKIRGLRANYIISDEFASLPEEIFNIVIMGFGSVASDPVGKVKEAATVKRLKKMGVWNSDLDLMAKDQSGNQVVYSGTAYYAFNHFYKRFQKFHDIISSKGDSKKLGELLQSEQKDASELNWKDYAILRVPYNYMPEGFMDAGILAQAKTTMHTGQFFMEYGACFMKDSNGFYKRSIIEACTTNHPIQIASGKNIQFHTNRHGDPKKVHVLAVDPAADQDNAAIVILELNEDHRKVVYCWTTNKKRYAKYKEYMRDQSVELSDDYYTYLAKKIRALLRDFNIEHIIMDKNGGGTAIAEALSNPNTCLETELPIYQIIDPEDLKFDDVKEGLHILQLLAPNPQINSDANHGMLKDMQDKVLLFPMFDTIEMAKAIEIDKVNNIKFDTYERLVQEVEELKNEITTIVCTETSTLGNEKFDTPEIKLEGSKKGRLRKDRYSALLYANYYARNKDKNEPPKLVYKPTGGTKETLKTQITPNDNKSLYYGPGMIKFGSNPWKNYAAGICIRRD